MSQGDRADACDDRLIFLADALKLVPFSETTLHRAITKGEREAWQPNTDGKIVMWSQHPDRMGDPATRAQQPRAAAPRAPVGEAVRPPATPNGQHGASA